MKKCTIYYYTLTDEMRKEEKWEWFSENKIKNISFEHIQPDKNNNWLDLTDNDWDTMIPIANKESKLSKNKNDENAIFKLFSLGIATNRDEWVYDYDKNNLDNKIRYFIEVYDKEKARWVKSDKTQKINDFVDRKIKWTEELEGHLKKNSNIFYNNNRIVNSIYRPFCKQFNYYDKIITHRIYQQNYIFPIDCDVTNRMITIHNHIQLKSFEVHSTNLLTDQGYCSRGTPLVPLYRYSEKGNKIDNITDWGLEQFRVKYEQIPLPPFPKGENQDIENTDLGNPSLEKGAGGFDITKEDIFHYVYAVLHNPEYRKKYEMNLKREFPRIPFYEDFWKWAGWGKQLMDLHINFETTNEFPLEVTTIELNNEVYKAKLKANKENGTIELDNLTTISGIPKEAWEYKLGNRSALEWILDQYKEKKPKDPTIAEKFNTYRFIDYKDKVIDLIKRVTTVSVETVKIVEEMRGNSL